MQNAQYLVAALLAYIVTYFFQGGPEDKKKRATSADAIAGAVAQGKMISGNWMASWSNLGASEMLFSALVFMFFNLLPWQSMPFGSEINLIIQFVIFSVLGYMMQVFLQAKLDISGWEWMLGPLVPLAILWAVGVSFPIVTTAYQWAMTAFLGVSAGA